MKFEAYKLFDGSGAISEEDRARLAEGLLKVTEIEPLGIANETFWLDLVERQDENLFICNLKLEYVQEREELEGGRRTRGKTYDLVETRGLVIDLNNGLLVMEDRQFRDRGVLTKNSALFKLTSLLTQAFRLVDLEDPSLEPLRIVREAEALRVAYTRHHVISISVTDLAGRSIPEGVKIYNPREDSEKFIRELLEEETRDARVDKIALESADGGDLRKSHLAKAAILAGEPEQLEVVEERPDGQAATRVIKRTQNEPVEVDLAVESANPEALLEALAIIHEALEHEGLLDQVRVRVRRRNQGDLFRE